MFHPRSNGVEGEWHLILYYENNITAMRYCTIPNQQLKGNGKQIDEAISGEVRVNDLNTYIEWRKSNIVASLIGLSDHTVAFLQMAVYIQTGESVPLLN